jgi:lipoprotein-releasing system ATP-binding protein
MARGQHEPREGFEVRVTLDFMILLTSANLHKTYRLGRVDVPVLRGVSLSVERGECVAILGSSGSGKSTLLHLLGGLDRPDRDPAGSIVFDGADITNASSGQLNTFRGRDVGFVFQFYHLLPELSVLQNVLIAAMVRQGVAFASHRHETKTLALELLDKVGLSHRLRHRPVELSGGERQRVAIARALINRPRLLLADEPTGNLDQATGATILDMLGELRATHAQTMLIVTHDLQTAARADRVVRLRDGLVAS